MFVTASSTTSSTTHPISTQVSANQTGIPNALRFCITGARTRNTAEIMLTGKKRLHITFSAQYATPQINLTNQACPPRMIFNAHHREAVEYCSVTEGIHTHSNFAIQIVPTDKNPLPDGVTKKTQRLEYADERMMNLPVIPNWKSGLLTTITESELPEQSQCLNATMEYHPPMHTTISIPVYCKVEDGIHQHHAFPIPIYLPLEPSENRSIPPNAFSFTQTITHAPNCSYDPPYAIIKEKQQRLGLGTFKLPKHWMYFTESIQEFYINDMVSCYNLGLTYKEIAHRHSVMAVHVRAILLLQLDEIRSSFDEKMYAKTVRVSPELPSLGQMPTLKQFMSDFDIQWRQSFLGSRPLRTPSPTPSN